MKHSWEERIRWCEAVLSRKEIADYCGLPYSTFSDLVNGRTAEPRGYAAVRLYNLSKRHKPTTSEEHAA